MESSVRRGLDLDISDGGSQDAIHDEDEREEDLSRALVSCSGGIDSAVEGSIEILPTDVEPLELSLHKDFKSKDDAKDCYISYGRRIGFTIRTHHVRRSRKTNAVISQDFICSKAKRYVSRRDKVLPPPVSKERCPAMLRVTVKDGGKWVVTKFEKEHNHNLLSPSKIPWRRSEKILVGEDEKDKKIRELTNELVNERRRCKRQCAVYQEQLQTVLKEIERHNDHLSKTVQDIVKSIKEMEDQSPQGLDSHDRA